MKLSKIVTLTALPISLFFACNQNRKDKIKDILLPEKAANSVLQEENKAAPDSIAISADYQEDKLEENQNEQKQKTPAQKINHEEKIDWDKKIIKSASLNVEVKDYSIFNNQLHELVKKFGGYVAQEEQNQSAYQIENNVSIKIPVDQFDDAVSKLAINSSKIIERKITSNDVTSEMVDTKSRIQAKKEIRLRYLDLLKQAKNMKDILDVQNEINEIQEQLESAAGRVAYLNHSSAFSTINVTFYQITDATAINEKEPTYLHKINESFFNGLKWISDLALGMVSLWPLIIAAFGIFILYKKRRAGKIKTINS